VAPSPTLLVGPEASEQELQRLAQSGDLAACRTIHLATHALADPEQSERSCLILSQVDLPDAYAAAVRGERIYDGRLTVQEILQEWKLDADLVTLSACETGLGQDVQGEGLVGFAHAFLQAGARSLLVSLWKVDDKATSLLMTRFYGNLWQEKMPKAAALREAKQWLRGYEDEPGHRPYDHPYFWSAFILIGDRG
jgi:CHAT domain-containing protein